MADTLRQDDLMKLKVWSPLAPLVLALAALVFGLDQTHKWWMLSIYGIADRAPVPITPFFELVMVWNSCRRLPSAPVTRLCTSTVSPSRA